MTDQTTKPAPHGNLARERDNIGQGTTVLESNTMSVYDRLPPELRRLFAEAPYDYELSATVAALQRHRQPRARERWITTLANRYPGIMADDVGMHSFALYGEKHPQAKRPSTSTLRRRGLFETWRNNEAWRSPCR